MGPIRLYVRGPAYKLNQPIITTSLATISFSLTVLSNEGKNPRRGSQLATDAGPSGFPQHPGPQPELRRLDRIE